MYGYRGRPDWRDMSEYVVHFAKDFDGRDAYTNMLQILGSGHLQPGPAAFGAGRGLDALGDSQRSVSFSEIPLDLLERLVERRSKYGIGFTQKFLVGRGGARVWYLDMEGVAARVWRVQDPEGPFIRRSRPLTRTSTLCGTWTASSGRSKG